MATTADYLTQLQADKQTLVDNLVAKGVEASNDETFTTLAPKVADISSGGIEITNASYLFYSDARTDIMNELCNAISPSCTNFSYMFSSTTIEEIPLFNTSNGTNFSNMFNGNREITHLPLFDTSKGTTFDRFASNCNALTEIPQLNTSNGTNFIYMFSYCSALTEIPQLNTSKGTSFSYAFSSCTTLTTIPLLDFEKATDVSNILSNTRNLTTLGGLKNLGKAYLTSRSANYSSYKLDLSQVTLLTHESLMNVINNLYDIASIEVKPQQLVLGTTNLAKLTEEEIAIATNKGWNVS